MISYPIQGQPQTFRQADVASASDTTLFTCGANFDALLECVKVCNKTAGAVNVDAWWGNGSATDYLLKGKSIAANDTLFLDALSMRYAPGETLKVKASAGTSLDVSATFVLIHKNTPR